MRKTLATLSAAVCIAAASVATAADKTNVEGERLNSRAPEIREL